MLGAKAGSALAFALVLSGAASLGAQQVPDRDFRPPVPHPGYAAASGPRLCLDEAHHNFHTLADRFWAFGELARRDGFRVGPSREPVTAAALAKCDLFVISNAQPNGDDWDKYPTPTPSAFSDAEITAMQRWVDDGGRLLLIADHMPLAGAAMKLAAAFGATFTDGFAYKAPPAGAVTRAEIGRNDVPTLFGPADGTLADHPIARGRDSTERVTQVQSFTGQAFRVDGATTAPVLVLPSDFIVLKPRIAWEFDAATPREAAGGWSQGATRRIGRGRVAFFGEAAMFSAQVTGPQRRPMGMNAPLATQNAQFALNTLHWLSGLIEP